MGRKLSREEVLEIVRLAREKGERPDIRGVDLRGRDLGGIDLKEADLSRANLREVDLSRANLVGGDLSETTIIGANLSEATITRADFRRATIIDTNLIRANLAAANFFWADLRLAHLVEANLSEASLSGVNLSRAHLGGANLSGAHLANANLADADLRGANLSRAYLGEANLSRAYLDEADLSGITLWNTNFGTTDLSKVKGLETAQHNGPSTIGTDTLFLSKGQIPKVFLHGAGVPTELISYLEKIKTPECPYTREQLDEWIRSGQTYLTTVTRSLNLLMGKKAKYGLDVPLHIEHQIHDYEVEQGKTEGRISEYQRLRTLYYPSSK